MANYPSGNKINRGKWKDVNGRLTLVKNYTVTIEPTQSLAGKVYTVIAFDHLTGSSSEGKFKTFRSLKAAKSYGAKLATTG